MMTDPTEVKALKRWGKHTYAIRTAPDATIVTGEVISLPSFPWVLFGVRKRPGEGALWVEEITTGLGMPVHVKRYRDIDAELVKGVKRAVGRKCWLVHFINKLDSQLHINAVRWPHLGTGTRP